MAFAEPVVMLGVSWLVLLGVLCPLSASIGFAASTRENDWMPPTMNVPPAIRQTCVAGSPGAAVLRYIASAFEVWAALFMRRTIVQPAGGVANALEWLNAIAATMTSPGTVPAGVAIERFAPAGRSARRCALPTSAFPSAVAFEPVDPATL